MPVSQKIENINGIDIPVERIDFRGRCSEENSESHAKLAFNDRPFFDMKKYSKAIYIEQANKNVYAMYGCYAFEPTGRHGIHFKYKIFKIKYDNSPDDGRYTVKEYYDNDEYLNNINRTWYEND